MSGAVERLERGERLPAAGVARNERDPPVIPFRSAPLSGSLAVTSFDHTSGVAGDRRVHRHRAFMEQVERPNV